MIVWIIGISGAGKSTVADKVVDMLRQRGSACLLLDGDSLRDVWGDSIGHTTADRRKNHTRISHLCKLLEQEPSVHQIVPALSIFPDLRKWNRDNFQSYLEVYLDIPVAVAESRDPKGIYARRRAGELNDVVGIDIPFPEPETADLRIDGQDIMESPEEIAGRIIASMDQHA